ncbi:hypothetical protein FRC08_015893 [Ceratobasidium sp. 394]|nr:hypothetical protein FRC08_015893 [Ceratobasidium sp. 394]
MATAAQAMSDASRAFSAFNAPTPDATTVKKEESGRNTESVHEIPEHESEDDLMEISSDICLSETSSGDVILYDSDSDLPDISTNTTPISPVIAPHDPKVSSACSSRHVDISQILLSPYPPPPQSKMTLGIRSPSPPVYNSSNLSDAPSAGIGSRAAGGCVEAVEAGVQEIISDDNSSDSTALISPGATAEVLKETPVAVADPPERRFSLANSNTSKLNTPTSAVYPPTQPLSLQQSILAYPKLPSGRDYIQLEEDFDAIPIICCMALASKKTICLVPSPESLSAYKKILSSITELDVFVPMGGAASDRVEKALGAFRATPSAAILLLAFQDAATMLLETTSADCIIHWGWPETRQIYMKLIALMKLDIRSCLIIPTGEHLKPLKDSKPSDYGVVKYSDTVLGNFFGPKSPIHEVRRITTKVLAGSDAETMKVLYYSWLDYYGIGSTRRNDWTVVELMNYARAYAAKTLLRGPASDGSKLYPPTCGRQLPIPEWVIRALDVIQPIPVQPASIDHQPEQETEVKEAFPVQSIAQNVLSTSVTTPLASHSRINVSCFPCSIQLADGPSGSGQYYVVLDEEFDTLPFISYLALKNNKTVCCVPGHESLLRFEKLFALISDLNVLYPLAMDDAKQAHAEFAAEKKQLMLLQSYSALQSAPLPNSTADALICWGYPENIESYVNVGVNGASRSYLILSPEEYARPPVKAALSRFGIGSHPSSELINDIRKDSLLHQARQIVMEHIRTNSFSSLASSFYYAFVSYYSVGRGRPTGLTPEAIARTVNRHAARVFLRGRKEDGSQRYPPVGDRPTLTPGAIKAFRLKDAQVMELLN